MVQACSQRSAAQFGTHSSTSDVDYSGQRAALHALVRLLARQAAAEWLAGAGDIAAGASAEGAVREWAR